MSDWFFTGTKLPVHAVNLEQDSGSQNQQTGGVMIAYEK